MVKVCRRLETRFYRMTCKEGLEVTPCHCTVSFLRRWLLVNV